MAALRIFKALFNGLIVLTFVWGLAEGWGALRSGGERSPAAARPLERTKPAFEPRPRADYLRALSRRDLFESEEAPVPVVARTAPPKPPAPLPPPPPPVHVPTLAERAANLSLMGVLQSGRPQAILLDRRTQKTYYLAVGESVDGLRIVAISGSRVTLGCGQETLDLAL